MVRSMSTILLIALLGACTTVEPERNDAASYINAVMPLMLENRMLSERRLQIAAGLYNKKLPNDAVVQKWNTEVIPVSAHLHHQAGLVEVPESWADPHANLVLTWTDRTHAYTAMAEALALADEKRWEQARNLHGEVIKREELWFESCRSRLAKWDLELEQFP